MASPSITHERTGRLSTAVTIFGYRAVKSEPFAGGEPDAILVAPGEDAEAVVLDFVNPIRARRRLLGRARQAWFEGDAMMQHAGTEKRSVEARSSAMRVV
jgi:hypothetical protein